WKANARVISPFANKHLAHGVATDPGFDQVRNVRDIDTVTGGGGTVDLDGDLRQRRLLVDRHVGGAGRGLENVDNLFFDAAPPVEVVAQDLDDQLAVRAGDLVVDPIDHGLAKPDIESGHCAESRGHARDQIPFGFAGWPSVVGVKADACFDVRRRPRIGTVIVPSQLGYDVGYLGELA